MNILVLSAGGPTAHGVIKSLRNINFDGKIVSIDCNELSAGFKLSDTYYIVPKAFDKNYIELFHNDWQAFKKNIEKCEKFRLTSWMIR